MSITKLVLLCLVAYAAYTACSISYKVVVSRHLPHFAPFQLLSKDHSRAVLILGDSTAVGLGASKVEDTIPALIAGKVGATFVENYAAPGATVDDLKSQAANAKLEHYRYTIIQIGGNDIIHFHGAREASMRLQQVLSQLPRTDRIVVFASGNVGSAPFFPWFMRPLYTRLNLKYHTFFSHAVSQQSGVYVNLYEDPAQDPFVQEPGTYFSADGLHPSSEGYKLWFIHIARVL